MSRQNAIAAAGHHLPDVSCRKVFVLDWDGTLFDSMAVKLRSFSQVASEYLAQGGAELSVEAAAELYRTHSGRPRREIFAIVARSCGVELSETDLGIMSDRLTSLNYKLLADAAMFDDGLALLACLAAHGKVACISSSVPQNELDHFVALKVPPDLRYGFRSVFGSRPGFGKGPAHLKRLMEDTRVSAERVLVIGDDEADHELSAKAGVDCIVVNRDNRSMPARIPTIQALTELCPRIN
jgi:phosphoglycolate phosphatase-like HAD superfamily hydrolase